MEQRMASRDFSLDSPLDDDHDLTHLDLLQETSLNQEESLALMEEKKIRERVRQIESKALKKLRKKMSPNPRTEGLTEGREDAYPRIPVQPLQECLRTLPQ